MSYDGDFGAPNFRQEDEAQPAAETVIAPQGQAGQQWPAAQQWQPAPQGQAAQQWQPAPQGQAAQQWQPAPQGQAAQQWQPAPQGQAGQQWQGAPQWQAGPQAQGSPQYYGAPQFQAGPQQAVLPKNPAVGLICSFFIPGLGSMINGNTSRGVVILIVYIVGWILSFFLIGIPVAIGAWIWGLVDGYQSAQRWNREHGIVS